MVPVTVDAASTTIDTSTLLPNPVCDTVPMASPSPYSVRLVLDSTRLIPGGSLSGNVVFANPSRQMVDVVTNSAIEVVLTRPGSDMVIGVPNGPWTGTGFSFRLGPGSYGHVPIFGGTTRCGAPAGTVLPPGRYQAVGEISGPNISGLSDPTYETPRVNVRVAFDRRTG